MTLSLASAGRPIVPASAAAPLHCRKRRRLGLCLIGCILESSLWVRSWLESSRRPAALPGILQQGAHALAGHRPRIEVGVRRGEGRGAVEVRLREADLAQPGGGAD